MNAEEYGFFTESANSASKKVICEKGYALGEALSSCGVTEKKFALFDLFAMFVFENCSVDKNNTGCQYNFAP